MQTMQNSVLRFSFTLSIFNSSWTSPSYLLHGKALCICIYRPFPSASALSFHSNPTSLSSLPPHTTMTPPLNSALLLSLLLFSTPQLTLALHDCYYYGGYTAANNTLCAGSSTCCGPTADCQSYRLCHNEGDPDDVFVRGPCAVWPWDLSVCPQICLWSKSTQPATLTDESCGADMSAFCVADETTGVFPRVKQCPDQSWCCSNQTGNAVANDVFDCCENGGGVFIDALGYVISASSSSAVATAAPTEVSTKPAETTTKGSGSKESQTAKPAGDGELTTGSKVGIGVGVGIGALVIGAAVGWMVYRRLTKKSNGEKDWAPPPQYPTYDERPRYGSEAQFVQMPSEVAATQLSELPPSERDSMAKPRGGSSGVELPGSPTTGRGSRVMTFELDGGS